MRKEKRMKFLFFADGHLRGINSVNRKGDYFSDWMDKFDELLAIAKKEKCDFIIDVGDLFDVSNPSFRILDALADKVEKAKINIYSLQGNHNLHCGHIENSSSTGLAHLQKRCKYFNNLLEFDSEGFKIIGVEYEHNIEEQLKEGIFFNSDVDDYKILVVHALVTPGKFFDEVSYLTPEQFPTDANLVLLGHYHHPFAQKVGNTDFLNIGCFGRLSIAEHDIEPSVAIIDTDLRQVKVIKLKSAKPGNKIFDLEKYNELKVAKKDIKDFLESLNSVEWQSMSIRGQIEKIGKEQKVDKEIISYLVDKIGECNVE
jgi:DNA repair exonuclease SbcCD nuclease subunit